MKLAWIDDVEGSRKRIVELAPDTIVEAVMVRMAQRSQAGMKTYGVPMTRPDVSTVEWLRHAQEEAMDLAVYLERVISDLSSEKSQ